MAYNINDDLTLAWLLKNNRGRIYRQLVDDTKKGQTGLATAEQMQAESLRLSTLIQEAADAQAETNIELANRIEQESGVLLYIDSSRGTVFKNNAVDTRLTIVIYKSGERITNATRMHEVFGSSSRLQWSWRRMDDSQFGVISSSDERIIDDGFTFILSPEDVDTKVTFTCELITD